MYTLNTPLTAIVDGQAVSITELEVPEKLTVGQLRKGVKASQSSNAMLFALEMAATIAGLAKAPAAQLTMPDAIGYLDVASHLLDGSAPVDVNVGMIRPVRALISKVTASAQDNPIEWGAQVLQHGLAWSAERVNDLPAGDMLALLPELLEGFFMTRPA